MPQIRLVKAYRAQPFSAAWTGSASERLMYVSLMTPTEYNFLLEQQSVLCLFGRQAIRFGEIQRVCCVGHVAPEASTHNGDTATITVVVEPHVHPTEGSNAMLFSTPLTTLLNPDKEDSDEYLICNEKPQPEKRNRDYEVSSEEPLGNRACSAQAFFHQDFAKSDTLLANRRTKQLVLAPKLPKGRTLLIRTYDMETNKYVCTLCTLTKRGESVVVIDKQMGQEREAYDVSHVCLSAAQGVLATVGTVSPVLIKF